MRFIVVISRDSKSTVSRDHVGTGRGGQAEGNY